jgi:hypothetical protein
MKNGSPVSSVTTGMGGFTGSSTSVSGRSVLRNRAVCRGKPMIRSIQIAKERTYVEEEGHLLELAQSVARTPCSLLRKFGQESKAENCGNKHATGACRVLLTNHSERKPVT